MKYDLRLKVLVLTNLRRFGHFVIFERIEVILNVQRRALLGCTSAKEWVWRALRLWTGLRGLRLWRV